METTEPILVDGSRTLGIVPDLEMVATHVPTSYDPNSEEMPVKWKIKIKRGRSEMETDYSTGIGHVVGYYKLIGLKTSIHNTRSVAELLWTGKKTMVDPGKFISLKTPTLDDVMHCLISDADTIDYPNFEDWANCFGYEADSRSAEKIYRACLEIGLKLRSMLGDEKLRQLRDNFQDF
jgi:hypothetical protein